MKKIKFTNKTLNLFLLGLLVLSLVGLTYAYNPGHLFSSVSAPADCTTDQIIRWTGSSFECATIGTPVVTNVILSSSSHDGDFGGRPSLGSWVQSSCGVDYHVCTVEEVVRAKEIGLSFPTISDAAWVDGRETFFVETIADSYTDCSDWADTSVNNLGRTLLSSGKFSDGSSCANSYPVLCCTYRAGDANENQAN